MRKESTVNQGFDENLICRSLEFFALQKIGMTCLLYLLMSTTAHAECVPAPDCGELGYTATSCEGGFVRCPFDTTKLFCAPCDSVYQYSCTNAGEIGKGNSCNGKYIECGCADGYEVDGTGCKLSCATTYQYTCSGTGYDGGSGTACGGMYESCTCASGYAWKDGSCQPCDNSCTVGNILYSDGSCSSCVISGKTAIGVVVKDNELVLSQRSSSKMYWTKAYLDTSLTNYDYGTDAKTDFNGKSNTATIIADDTSNRAAKHCNNYTTAGTSAGDWYLPAAGELYSYVYSNYNVINTTMTSIGWTWGNYYLWSSSESNAGYAWGVYAYDGYVNNADKRYDNHYVSCLLTIN